MVGAHKVHATFVRTISCLQHQVLSHYHPRSSGLGRRVHTMAVAPKPPLTRRLDLPAHVQRLRCFLLDVARFGEDEGKWENLEVRFAGGWVRDMLLQWPSDDIDVALSSVTGVSFVATLQAYLETEQCLNEHGLSKSDVGRMYKVDANVAKSKHLETATLPILGVDLDFVNLRKEVYNHDSRTPVMQFGTAREDAVRRDATINALFYNLHTEEVEDFTTGLADLDSGLIRTPMDPYQTFMDDPLRILRLVRFASRYNFPIVDNVKACMGRREVLDAFMAKISRERVGIELLKMFKGRSGSAANILTDITQLLLLGGHWCFLMTSTCTRRYSIPWWARILTKKNEKSKA